MLKWIASSSTVFGYNVYRSTTNGSNYTKINGSLVSALKYSDSTSTVRNGTTYYYVTTAADASENESDYSKRGERGDSVSAKEGTGRKTRRYKNTQDPVIAQTLGAGRKASATTKNKKRPRSATRAGRGERTLE